MGSIWTRHREPTELHERGLAALVALGWAKGRDAFVETLRGNSVDWKSVV